MALGAHCCIAYEPCCNFHPESLQFATVCTVSSMSALCFQRGFTPFCLWFCFFVYDPQVYDDGPSADCQPTSGCVKPSVRPTHSIRFALLLQSQPVLANVQEYMHTRTLTRIFLTPQWPALSFCVPLATDTAGWPPHYRALSRFLHTDWWCALVSLRRLPLALVVAALCSFSRTGEAGKVFRLVGAGSLHARVPKQACPAQPLPLQEAAS